MNERYIICRFCSQPIDTQADIYYERMDDPSSELKAVGIFAKQRTRVFYCERNECYRFAQSVLRLQLEKVPNNAAILESPIPDEVRISLTRSVLAAEYGNLEQAPQSTIFVCHKCGRAGKNKARVRMHCGPDCDIRDIVLCYEYSIKRDSQGFVRAATAVSRRDN